MLKKFGKLLGITTVIIILSSMTALYAFANQNEATHSQNQQDDEHAYLGVQVHNTDAGVTVAYIFPDSAAAQAGIEIDDIILTYNDVEMATSADLIREVGNSAPGDSVTLSIQRGDETLEVTAELGVAPAGFAGGGGSTIITTPHNGPIIIQHDGNIPGWGGIDLSANNAPVQLGVMFTSLTPEIAAEEELTVEDGALITEVLEGSPAEDAGFTVGDVVTAVDGDAVDIEHTLSDRLYAYEAEDHVLFTVQRGAETLEISAVLASDHPAKHGNGLINLMPGGWGQGAGDAFPWINHPLEIEGMPIEGLYIDGLPMDGNISIQMSTEPPALEDVPEGAHVYACTMPGNDHTMYVITEGMDAPPMMDCEPYMFDVDQIES